MNIPDYACKIVRVELAAFGGGGQRVSDADNRQLCRVQVNINNRHDGPVGCKPMSDPNPHGPATDNSHAHFISLKRVDTRR
jgi:hypothetical protein